MSKTINIENFFTEKNEQEGVWHEPVIDGKPIGLEFLLIGIHPEEVAVKLEELDERSEAIRKSDKDDLKKREELEDLDAERVAILTKDIRAKNGATLVVNDEPIEFSVEFMKDFYKKCPSIKMDNIEFVLKSSNFMILD